MIKSILGHDAIKDRLKYFVQNMPKIILFNGPRGVGKKHIALSIINEMYGGSVNVFNHPDVKVYQPEKSVFKLGMVHEIQQEIALTPFELDKKFFILANIDRMTKEAANASLKMFEDVPDNVHFILTCEDLDSVLTTIQSRTTILSFSGITDLGRHFPNLSQIETLIVNGCIGKIKYTQDNLLDEKYNEILEVFSRFETLSFSDVLDFLKKYKEIDSDILSDLFILCAHNLADTQKKSIFIKYFLDFKTNLKLNLTHDMHLRLCLLMIRKKLSEK